MSSKHDSNTSRVNSGQERALRTNRVAAQQLPPPEETYTRRDCPAELQSIFDKFAEEGIVRALEPLPNEPTVYEWETKRKVYRYVQDNIAGQDGPWPRCPHSGFRNLGNKGFTCKEDSCDERYTREEAAEVLNRA